QHGLVGPQPRRRLEIEQRDRVAGLAQRVRDVAAEEAAGAGDEDLHGTGSPFTPARAAPASDISMSASPLRSPITGVPAGTGLVRPGATRPTKLNPLWRAASRSALVSPTMATRSADQPKLAITPPIAAALAGGAPRTARKYRARSRRATISPSSPSGVLDTT